MRIGVLTRAKIGIDVPHGHFQPALHRGPRFCPPAGVVFLVRPWCAVLALWRVGVGGLDLNPNSPRIQHSWEHYALATLRCVHGRSRFDSSNRNREHEHRPRVGCYSLRSVGVRRRFTEYAKVW